MTCSIGTSFNRMMRPTLKYMIDIYQSNLVKMCVNKDLQSLLQDAKDLEHVYGGLGIMSACSCLALALLYLFWF